MNNWLAFQSSRHVDQEIANGSVWLASEQDLRSINILDSIRLAAHDVLLSAMGVLGCLIVFIERRSQIAFTTGRLNASILD